MISNPFKPKTFFSNGIDGTAVLDAVWSQRVFRSAPLMGTTGGVIGLGGAYAEQYYAKNPHEDIDPLQYAQIGAITGTAMGVAVGTPMALRTIKEAMSVGLHNGSTTLNQGIHML